MARLTEEMVISRTRASDLSNIKKLNCWGADLTDVSILRRMQNVEVLALSLNKIHSLSDFQYCRNLQELYVRNNSIRDLNQILYLQDLPRLKNLWLDENPCANTESYRLTVLRALPNLQKLDNVIVQPEEVQDAMRKGRELIHPEEQQDESPEQQWPYPGNNSSSYSPPREQDRMVSSDCEDFEDDDNIYVRSPVVQRSLPPQQIAVNPREVECPEVVPRQRQTPNEERRYYETDRRNANYDQDIPAYSRPPSGQYGGLTYESSNNVEATSPTGSVKDEMGPPPPNTQENSLPSSKDVSPTVEEVQRARSNSVYHNNHYHQGADSGSDGSLCNSRSGRVYEEDRPPYRQDSMPQRLSNHRSPYPRRPTTKNSNILSAVLCLIKELDYESLEVVEVAVRSRIDEF